MTLVSVLSFLRDHVDFKIDHTLLNRVDVPTVTCELCYDLSEEKNKDGNLLD